MSHKLSMRAASCLLSAVFTASAMAQEIPFRDYTVSFDRPTTGDAPRGYRIYYKPFDIEEMEQFNPAALGCTTGQYGPETVFDPSLGLWPDASIYGNQALQTDPAKRPSVVMFNGQQGLRFDGLDDILPTSVPVSATSAYTVLVAVQTRNAPDPTTNSDKNLILTSGQWPHKIHLAQDSAYPNRIYSRSQGVGASAYYFDTAGERAVIIERASSGLTGGVETFAGFKKFSSSPTGALPSNLLPGTLAIGGDPYSSGRGAMAAISRVVYCPERLDDYKMTGLAAWAMYQAGVPNELPVLDIIDPNVAATMSASERQACNSNTVNRCAALTPEENAALCLSKGITGPNAVCATLKIPFQVSAAMDPWGKIFARSIPNGTGPLSAKSDTARLPFP